MSDPICACPTGWGALQRLRGRLRYAEEVGALRAEQAEHWRATGWQVMLRLDPLRQKAVAGAPAGEGEQPLTYLGGAEGALIGDHSRHYFHILPSAAYNTVARFARVEGRHFGTKAHMLWKATVEEGMLDVDDDQHVAAKVMIQGESRRMLRLHRSAVEKLWGVSPAKSVSAV